MHEEELVEHRYSIGPRIGTGGTSCVWEGVDALSGHRMALKFLTAAAAKDLHRLRLEARILQRLSHPNVLRAERVMMSQTGVPVMVMELLIGESLRARLERSGSLPVGIAASLLLDATCAVEAAHALTVTHRDLKPDNIFLCHEPPHVKVLDFGLARPSRQSDLRTQPFTASGTIVGTPHYMSPEQVFGEADVDGRSDVWSLGVILFECMTGTRPFFGDNPGQLFKAITMGPAPTLAPYKHIPSHVAQLVLRMLERDRTLRPTLAEVRGVLSTVADVASTSSHDGLP